jgi:selenophosphate synthetase-related protein
MNLDLAKIRATAENATPGPWIAFSDEICIATEQEVGLRYPTIASNIDSRKKWFNYADSQFIATVNPQTVIALLDLVESLKCCGNCKHFGDWEPDNICATQCDVEKFSLWEMSK